MSKRFSIVAAMEELQEEQAVAQATEETTDAGESAETAMLEAVEASAEVDAADVEVEGAVEATQTLDKLADTMEASEEKGGMDETAVAISEVAIESLYKKIGVVRRKPMPAMETFGSQSTRLKATKVAVENLREAAKAGMEAVLKVLAKIAEAIKKFFEAIWNSTGRLLERAKNLLKKAEAAPADGKGETVEGEEVPAGMSNIADDKGVVDAAVVATEAAKMEKAIDDTAKFVETVTAAADSSQALKTAGEETVDLSAHKSVTAEAGGKKVESKDAVEGMEVKEITEEFFNQTVTAQVAAEGATGEAAAEADAKSKVWMAIKSAPAKAVKLMVAGKDKMIAILKSVIASLEKLVAAKPKVEKAGATQGKIAGAFKKGVTAIKEGSEKVLSTLKRWATAVANFVSRPFVYVGKAVSNAAKSCMDYVELSLKKLKGDKPAADEKDAAPAAA